MRIITTLITLFIYFGCEQKVRDRRFKPMERQFSSSQSDLGPGKTELTGNKSFTEPRLDSGEVIPPQDAGHCQFSSDGRSLFPYFHSHLGDYAICQGKTNSSDFFLQLRTPIYDERICIIPTFNSESNHSIYLGAPRCQFILDSKTIYKFDLIKNRPSPPATPPYSTYTINSIILLRDIKSRYPFPFDDEINGPNAFIKCQEMLHMGDATYCDTFRSVGNYIFLKF